MKMGNVSKRQQPDQRTDKSPWAPKALKHSEKSPIQSRGNQPALKQKCVLSSVNRIQAKL